MPNGVRRDGPSVHSYIPTAFDEIPKGFENDFRVRNSLGRRGARSPFSDRRNSGPRNITRLVKL